MRRNPRSRADRKVSQNKLSLVRSCTGLIPQSCSYDKQRKSVVVCIQIHGKQSNYCINSKQWKNRRILLLNNGKSAPSLISQKSSVSFKAPYSSLTFFYFFFLLCLPSAIACAVPKFVFCEIGALVLTELL